VAARRQTPILSSSAVGCRFAPSAAAAPTSCSVHEERDGVSVRFWRSLVTGGSAIRLRRLECRHPNASSIAARLDKLPRLAPTYVQHLAARIESLVAEKEAALRATGCDDTSDSRVS
jgi:hypothetical protein